MSDYGDSNNLSRRRFVQQVGLGVAALTLTSCSGAKTQKPDTQPLHTEETNQLDDKYLEIGLTGFGRCANEKSWVQGRGGGVDNRTGTFNGHWGAAVIATYYMCKRLNFEKSVLNEIKKQLDLFIEIKKKFFKPFEDEKADPKLVSQITETVGKTIEVYRQHGHVVIFVSHALKALRDRPELAKPSIIKGILNIITEVDK